jgi:Arc/MetJ-type ribon-helix-helix transcriptional regulator
MTIHLPKDLESSIRAEVLSGHFASEEDLVTEAVREYLRHRRPRPQDAKPVANDETHGIGSIGAMRDAADELDEIVEDAMRKRREEAWRAIPGE